MHSESGLRCSHAPLYKSLTGNSFFSWQDKIRACRCHVVYSNTQMFHPLQDLCMVHILGSSANSQLSLSEGCSRKALQDITFFSSDVQRKTNSPRRWPLLLWPLRSFLSLPHLPARSIFWTPYSPLSCLKSALKTIFPFLPVFPLLLSPGAVNLVPLAWLRELEHLAWLSFAWSTEKKAWRLKGWN